MIESLHISKSFCVLGRSLPKCLGCKYCRLSDGSTDGLDLRTLPGEVNPILRSVPVAVNLFYGDPTLQVEHTVSLIRRLEADGHTGPVVVILKGDFARFSDDHFDLDLHFAFSTFGIDHNLDGGSRAQFLRNLRTASKRPQNRYSIEFRPIVYGVNDGRATIDWVMETAASFDLSVGYSGLQGKPSITPRWEAAKLPLRPYPGFRFGHKKLISAEVEARIQQNADLYGVSIFRKTSCLLSYVHELDRDYNAHYYRPTEVGCERCPMGGRCAKEKLRMDECARAAAAVIPFAHRLVVKSDHVCVLKRKGICEFPTDDCSHISGLLIQIDDKLTTADVRVIKWLTGMTVDADFAEIPHLSDNWRR